MSYKILGFPRSRAMRVIWMMEELGLDYELDPARPGSEDVRAVNPSGKVPVLLEDGVAIRDSVAICQYLADKHGGCTFAAGTAERAQQDSLTQFCLDEVEGPLWTHAKHSFALPEEMRLASALEIAAQEFQTALGRLEQRLSDGPYAMGESFTVPDILLGHCSVWALMLPKWPIESARLKAYFKATTARPAYGRAQARATSASG